MLNQEDILAAIDRHLPAGKGFAVLAAWGAYYLTELKARPVMNLNDPHLEEMLEPEHAH